MEFEIDIDELEIYSYYVTRSFDALLFSVNKNNIFPLVDYSINLHSFFSLILFKEYITNYNDIFNDDLKENVYKIVEFYRYEVEYQEHEKNKAMEMCNEIISFLNSKNGSDLKKFMYEELKIRGCLVKDEYKLLKNNQLDVVFQRLRGYYILDYYVLCLLLNTFNEEQTNNLIKTFSSCTVPFMYSINCLLYDCPQIFYDENTKTYIQSISTLLNQELNDLEIDKSDKNVLKKEYCLYKKKLRKAKINIE